MAYSGHNSSMIVLSNHRSGPVHCFLVQISEVLYNTAPALAPPLGLLAELRLQVLLGLVAGQLAEADDAIDLGVLVEVHYLQPEHGALRSSSSVSAEATSLHIVTRMHILPAHCGGLLAPAEQEERGVCGLQTPNKA